MCCFMWKDRGAYVWEDRERAYCFDFIRFLLWFLQEWAKNVGWKKMLNLVASRIVICFRIDRECEWVSERELTRTKRYHHEPSIHPVAAWYNVGCDSRSKNPYSFQTGFSVHESHLMPESDRYKRNTHQFHCECWLDGGAQCDFVSRSFCPTTRTLRNKKTRTLHTHTQQIIPLSHTLYKQPDFPIRVSFCGAHTECPWQSSGTELTHDEQERETATEFSTFVQRARTMHSGPPTKWLQLNESGNHSVQRTEHNNTGPGQSQVIRDCMSMCAYVCVAAAKSQNLYVCFDNRKRDKLKKHIA